MRPGRGIIAGAGLALLALTATPAASWTLSVCRPPDAAPYTQPDRQGIDDRVAAILAEEMGAQLQVVDLPDGRSRTQKRLLHAGGCDLVMSVTDKQKGFETSQVYYATGFVFVTRNGAPMPASLDDPALARLRIGAAGDPRHPIPPVIALFRRGHGQDLRFFPDARLDNAGTDRLLAALSGGEIDLAVLWGPTAAIAQRRDPALRLALVTPEIDLPVLPMIAMFTIGMRPGDTALRHGVNRALSRRWDEVQAVLTDAGIPLRPVHRPTLVAEATP